MPHRLNLARRPFVDTRPVNLTAAGLAFLVVVLTFVSVRTVVRYLDDSRRTRLAVASLREEIGRLETERRDAEARLKRFDMARLEADAADANEIALRRAFSWTRFLTRLEKTLPSDARIVSIVLVGVAREGASPSSARRGVVGETANVELILISRDPNALSRLITAFYRSSWFDNPIPHLEEGAAAAKGPPEGRRVSIGVTYRDPEGKAP